MKRRTGAKSKFVSRRDPLLRITEEPSNVSSVNSEYGNFFIGKRKDPGPTVPAKSWSLHAKLPQQKYEPILKDAYPRNEFTMMPLEVGFPRYFDGKFYRETSSNHTSSQGDKPSGESEARGVIFKPQNIEIVQTKKKYNEEIKGKSSISLHLCNDTKSDLFQRSLHEDYPMSGYPGAQRPGSNRSAPFQLSRSSTESTSVFDVKDTNVPLEDFRLRSGHVVTDDDLMSVMFPKGKVLNSLKFMGAPVFRNVPKSREYDINFNGKL